MKSNHGKNILSTNPFWPIVEKITTTGEATLDENLMKQIKRLCKYVRFLRLLVYFYDSKIPTLNLLSYKPLAKRFYRYTRLYEIAVSRNTLQYIPYKPLNFARR